MLSRDGMRRVLAARTVAALAAHVPLGDLLGVDVVANGMAAVARGAGRPLHVVGRIKLRPPIALYRRTKYLLHLWLLTSHCAGSGK